MNVTDSAGNAQVFVTWQAPASNGGSVITGYTVTAVQDTGKHCSTAGLTCQVTGLTNGAAYSFTVTATNGVGVGATASAPAVTPATFPGAPTNVTDTSGNGLVSVAWQAPASNGGSVITGYTVTAVQDTGKHCSTAGLTCKVSGLINGTSYTFTVTAANAVGVGAPASAPAVTPATFPGAPTGVSDTAGNAQVSVAWQAPAFNGGSVITGYTVTAVQDTGKHCSTTTTLSCTVINLINGNSYTFTVTAGNAMGTGPASAPSPSVKPSAPPNAPGPPQSVTAKPGNGRDTVTWLVPLSDSGSAITLYTVTSNPDGKTCTTTGGLSCVDSGLTNGTSYTFTVTATNSAGTGVASQPSAIAIPLGAPGVPAISSAAPGNGQVTVSWTAPSSNGGAAITLYTVAAVTASGSVPSGTPCAWSTGPLTCSVTGLTNGMAYTVSVTAKNSVGTGPASPSSAPVIPLTVPGAPSNVGVQGASGQVTVSWTAPSNGGSAITGYTVTASDTSKHCSTTTAVSCVVTGLNNNTSYVFTVVASNAAGAGPGTMSSPVTGILGFTSQNGFTLRMSGSSLMLRMPIVPGNVRVSILDVWGRKIWSRTVSGSIGQLTWDGLSSRGVSAPIGMYVLRLVFVNGEGNSTNALQTTFIKP